MKSTFGELGQIGETIGPDGYVSYASIGATVGMVVPVIGVLVGVVIGGIVDMVMSAKKAKKERKKLKKAFYAQLLKRYDTQIFISALERMGPAMVYLQALGLKPGSATFDKALKKKLYSEIGYKGNCAIDLFGPSIDGKNRKAIASISNHGKLTAYSPHIDSNLGPLWTKACKDLHKAALQSWAEEQRDNILFQRSLDKESTESDKKTITRLLVNSGVILSMLGYSIKQKKKLKGSK